MSTWIFEKQAIWRLFAENSTLVNKSVKLNFRHSHVGIKSILQSDFFIQVFFFLETSILQPQKCYYILVSSGVNVWYFNEKKIFLTCIIILCNYLWRSSCEVQSSGILLCMFLSWLLDMYVQISENIYVQTWDHNE